MTGQDMYRLTLALINKEQTGSLTVPEWERLVNKEALSYLTHRAEEFEKHQKRIDDLGDLVKDDILLPTAGKEFDFLNATVKQGGGALTDLAPAVAGRWGYFRALVVGTEFNYISNPCFANGVPVVASDEDVDWISTIPLRADQKFAIKSDAYDWPTDEYPKYEIRGSQPGKILKVINNTPSLVSRVYLKYLVHPRMIVIGATVAQNDFPIHARQEVVEFTVRRFLQKSADPVLQTDVAVDNMTKK